MHDTDVPDRRSRQPPAPAAVIETARLRLRHMLVPDDIAFVVELLNEPGFLQYIGDKGVRTDEDARRYIENGPRASYARFGFGLYTVVLKTSGEPAGICGLVKRDSLNDVDVGYAFLPQFRRAGYAIEAAAAVVRHGLDVLRLPRIVALTDPANERSIRLLEKLGLCCRGPIVLTGEARETLLFGS
jgi:RimJ/RimL family protein N-acetyltransferase